MCVEWETQGCVAGSVPPCKTTDLSRSSAQTTPVETVVVVVVVVVVSLRQLLYPHSTVAVVATLAQFAAPAGPLTGSSV